MTLVEVACAKILERVEQRMISIRGAIEDYMREDPSVKSVRDVILALCLETVRNYVLLDRIVEHVLGISVERLDLFTKHLIRVLAYEVKFRGYGVDRVQRVLKYCRRVKIRPEEFVKVRDVNVDDLLRELSYEDRLHVRYSVPKWLVKYLLERLNFVDVESLLKSFNEKLPMYIRVNVRRVRRNELLRALRERGVEAYEDPDLDDIIVVESLKVSLESLPEYRNGLFYIQDKASALVGHVISNVVQEQRPIKVVDLCSAPGGKAMHLQERLNCYVVGIDVSYRRVETERDLVKRYGYVNIDTVCANALRPPLREIEADVILLDPDCTSLGKLNHSPEVRLWIKRVHIYEHARHQYKLLKASIEKLKVRAKYLLYSTCTITVEENEDNVRKILEESKMLEIVDLGDMFAKFANTLLQGTLRLFPHVHKTTGYFISLLRLKKT